MQGCEARERVVGSGHDKHHCGTYSAERVKTSEAGHVMRIWSEETLGQCWHIAGAQ